MYYRSMPYFDAEEVAQLLARPPLAKSRHWGNWLTVLECGAAAHAFDQSL